MKRRVYSVHTGHGDTYCLCAVFATRKEAERLVEDNNGRGTIVAQDLTKYDAETLVEDDMTDKYWSRFEAVP